MYLVLKVRNPVTIESSRHKVPVGAETGSMAPCGVAVPKIFKKTVVLPNSTMYFSLFEFSLKLAVN